MRSITRTDLLQQLQSVSHGLSPRDIIEQSSCFVFDSGEIFTYNDEVACRIKTGLDLVGAVRAKPLMSLLERLHEDEVKLTTNEAELIVIGKKKKSGITMEAEVLLPINNVEKPGKFHQLHEDFLDAVSMCQECTGTDETKFWTTCVHLHPKWIEACDNHRILRYKLKTGVKESCLIRGRAIKAIVGLDMTHFSETDSWIHFKNKTGLVISCRRYIEEYPVGDLSKLIKFEGTKTSLPKGLVEAADRANVFSQENADNNQIMIELGTGKLKVTGEGVSGWYSETKKIKYKGPSIDFLIGPKLLTEITKRHNECELTEDRLKVNGGNWCYVTCLGKAGEDHEDEDQESEEGNDGEEDGSGDEE
jgi:DNA polymerase III sliding clamp (beta) subunit (PCNA family)